MHNYNYLLPAQNAGCPNQKEAKRKNPPALLRRKAKPNIEFLGWVDNQKISEYYSQCRAVIFPGEEDFGIVPVEAQACGKPVIAFGKGGALETVIPINSNADSDSATGIFFNKQSPESLIDAVEYFESVKGRFYPEKLRENALRFSSQAFKQNIKEYIETRIV